MFQSPSRIIRLIASLAVVAGSCLAGLASAQTPAPAPKAPAPKAADKAPSKPAPRPEPAAKAPDTTTDTGPNENSTVGSAEPSLPIPRFVSLRTDPVNLRTGPGVRYPVEWIYMRRRLPVEVIAEFETWRQIRDVEGAEGWVHQSMLSGRRTAIIRGEAQALRKSNVDQSEALAMLEPGVVVDIQRCPAEGPFCRVEVSGLQGWLKRDQFWGVYPQEKIE